MASSFIITRLGVLKEQIATIERRELGIAKILMDVNTFTVFLAELCKTDWYVTWENNYRPLIEIVSYMPTGFIAIISQEPFCRSRCYWIKSLKEE